MTTKLELEEKVKFLEEQLDKAFHCAYSQNIILNTTHKTLEALINVFTTHTNGMKKLYDSDFGVSFVKDQQEFLGWYIIEHKDKFTEEAVNSALKYFNGKAENEKPSI